MSLICVVGVFLVFKPFMGVDVAVQCFDMQRTCDGVSPEDFLIDGSRFGYGFELLQKKTNTDTVCIRMQLRRFYYNSRMLT